MAEYENIQEKLLRMLAVDVEIDREKWSSAGQGGPGRYHRGESAGNRTR